MRYVGGQQNEKALHKVGKLYNLWLSESDQKRLKFLQYEMQMPASQVFRQLLVDKYFTRKDQYKSYLPNQEE